MASVDRRILQVSRPARALLYLAVTFGFLAGAIVVAQAWLLGETVNRVFIEHDDLRAVQPLLIYMLILQAIRAALIWSGDVVAQRAASGVKDSLRTGLTQQLFALGPPRIYTERSGDLVSTIVEGVEALDEYITQYQPARLLAVVLPALVTFAVLLLDPWTVLVLVFAGPMLVLILALIGGRTRELNERRFKELRWMSAHFLDVLQGLPTLKLFGRSKEQAETIEEISRHFGDTTMGVLRTAFQTSLVLEWAAVAGTALVAVEVSLRLMHSMLPFDRALTVLLLTPEFFLPLRQLGLKYHAGTAGKAAAQRIFDILDIPVAAHDTAPTPTATGRFWANPQPTHQSQSVETASGALPRCFDIQCVGIDYAYESGRRPALRGLTLAVPHGQTVALVGPSGAGKTTVANLLLRFVEPDAGTILVGGMPLNNIDRAAWRTLTGWVPQHPHLFHGTVADNIRLARPQAGPLEVEAAARAAHADEFIWALPLGYDTPVNERGTRLSGGQRQRLAIARAFLKDAPILILDEATAHLDPENEALIQDALVRLMHGRTVLIIAHRMAVVYQADQIVVLDQGCAVEHGSHRSLLAAGGLYRSLVSAYEADDLRRIVPSLTLNGHGRVKALEGAGEHVQPTHGRDQRCL
jgi:thiol reductant ABC exporter CydD subunit